MIKVHKDIDYIHKAYDLVDHQYQEIGQEERLLSIKNKWIPNVEFPKKTVMQRKESKSIVNKFS